jgi:hypothetical protein
MIEIRVTKSDTICQEFGMRFLHLVICFIFIINILEMSKLRFKEGKKLSQSHIAEGKDLGIELKHVTPGAMLLTAGLFRTFLKHRGERVQTPARHSCGGEKGGAGS